MKTEVYNWLRTARLAWWSKFNHRVYSTHAYRDQVEQIIWRLEMNESSCPPDTRAALNLARGLRRAL